MELNSGSGLATLFLCALLLGGGTIALVWPDRIQVWTLGFYEGAHGLAKWNPLLDWMRTPSYVVSLRIVGALSIAAGCLVALALARGGA